MTGELNIEGPWVSPVRADEVRFWERVRAGVTTHPHDFHPDFVSSVVEVCEGCKVFSLRTKRHAFHDPMWSTIPVLRVYNNGRVRLEMEAFCPVCWTKLVWVMVHKHKPFFNGDIDVATALWSYVTGGPR